MFRKEISKYSKFPDLAMNLYAVEYFNNLSEPNLGSYFSNSNTFTIFCKNRIKVDSSGNAAIPH